MLREIFKGLRGKGKAQEIVAAIPYFWLIVFLLIPILVILQISFTEDNFDSPPIRGFARWTSNKTLILQINVSKYLNILQEPIYWTAFRRSLEVSLTSTFFCLLIGYPLAYGIVRSEPKWKLFLLMLVILPFWTPFLIRVYAWIGLLNENGVINTVCRYLHITTDPLPISNNLFSVCVGVVYSYLPFMVLPLFVALERVNFQLVEAAYDLGCRPLKAFWKIVLPLTKSGIYAGCLTVFIPVMGEFVIPELLGGIDEFMISKVLWMKFFSNSDWPQATSLAVVLIGLILLPMVFLDRISTHGLEKRVNR